VKDLLKGHFRPEFLNRVDEMIVFHPLGKEQLTSIVDVQLAHLRKRLQQRGLKLVLSDAAKKLPADEGYDLARRKVQAESVEDDDVRAGRVRETDVPEGDVALHRRQRAAGLGAPPVHRAPLDHLEDRVRRRPCPQERRYVWRRLPKRPAQLPSIDQLAVVDIN
jgi:hypothetical protein